MELKERRVTGTRQEEEPGAGVGIRAHGPGGCQGCSVGLCQAVQVQQGVNTSLLVMKDLVPRYVLILSQEHWGGGTEYFE